MFASLCPFVVLKWSKSLQVLDELSEMQELGQVSIFFTLASQYILFVSDLSRRKFSKDKILKNSSVI